MCSYQLRSELSNIEYKHRLLYEEAFELLKKVFPEEGTVNCEFLDDAGNEISEVSKGYVIGEMTYYPTEELTVTDIFQVVDILINQIISTNFKIN